MLASNYFPSTRVFVPTFYFPEYDKPVTSATSTHVVKTFNAETQFTALQDPTGIFQGRNYGSFTGYSTNDDTRKVWNIVTEKYKDLPKFLPEDQEVSNMLVYDFLGQSAGLPLGILKYKHAGFYVSYSVANDQTRFQLIRNAKVYGFASKLTVLSDLSEPGVVEKGAVVLLPPELPTLGLSAFDFISFNRNSVWIAVVFGADSAKVPQGFKAESHQGFDLWINTATTVWESAALVQRTIDHLKNQKSCLASNTKVEVYVPTFYEESTSVKEIPFKDLPLIKFSAEQLKTRDLDPAKLLTPEWMSQFNAYILDLLTQLKRVSNANFNPRDLLTQDFIKKYWLRAFVHETVNAENNLESLETIGDSALNFGVKQMLYNFNHKFTAGQLTNAYKKLTSKKVFGEYSRRIGLVKFAVLAPGVDLTVSIAEDILEAFAGAMVLAGDELSDGLGTVLVKNLVRSLMYHDVLGSKEALERLKDYLLTDKTTLIGTDYTTFVGKGSFEGSLRTTGDSAIYTIIITDRGLDNLRKLGFDPNRLKKKYVAKDEDKKAAKETASEMLFLDLKNIGLTYEVYDESRQLKKWNQSPALYKKYLQAKKIAERLGYSDIIVKIPESSKTLTKMILILIGQKEDKNYNLQVLAHQNDKGSVSEVNRHLATNLLLENFIAKYE